MLKSALWLPMAAIVCAAPAFAQEKTDFTGMWTTDFGTLTLTQTGATVNGKYDYQGPATLTGTLRGRTLSFTYKEASGATGKGEFTFSDDSNSFRGRWVSGSQTGLWNGKRQATEIAVPAAPAVNRSGTYKIGDIVEIWHNGDGQFRWMPSKILEIKDGKYTVHYGGSQYNVTTVTEDKIRNEARERSKEENRARWPLLKEAVQPYREALESFATEYDSKWWAQNRIQPLTVAELKKALADMAAVEALMAGKFTGMTAVQSGFDDTVMEHPEAWLEIAKARHRIAEGFAKKAARQKIDFEEKALRHIAEQLPQQDGFGLKQVGLDLVMGKRDPMKAKMLAPLTPLFQLVSQPVPDDLFTTWNAAADSLVATAKREASNVSPAANYTNAAFEAQVRAIWAKAWPDRKIVKIRFSRPDWHVTTNALGTPLYRHYGGMVQYRVAGFDYIIEQGYQRREDYQGRGKYSYRAAPYEPELRIIKP